MHTDKVFNLQKFNDRAEKGKQGSRGTFYSANFYWSLPTPVHPCGPAVHTALPAMSTANPRSFKKLFQGTCIKFPQVTDL